jgi:4'-phosphopantetheinyl transferase
MLYERFARNSSPTVLGEREVHLWCVRLDAGPEALPRLWAILSDAERERAQRYHFDRDRCRFVAGRARLRILLGHYLNTSAEAILFEYGPHGKPCLNAGCGKGLHLNWSHSESLALFAICANEELGVDIELVRPIADSENIVRRFFCPEEVEDWLSLPPELRARGFFDCWTRKETFMKATGEGLHLPLDSFQVKFRRGEEPSIQLGAGVQGEEWQMFDVSPEDEYSAALAIRGSGWELCSWMAFDDWVCTSGYSCR